MFRIAGIAGSLRKESLNKQVLIASQFLLPKNTELAILDWSTLPVYNQDYEDEKRIPDSVKNFRNELERADAVLFAVPEYNGSIPGPLKNAIDWVSRPYNANYELSHDMSSVVLPLSGKATAAVGATPGDYGSAATGRGQLALRQALIYPNSIMVNHPVVSVPKATTAFEDNGSLKSQVHADALRQLLVNLVKLGKQLATDVKV